MVYLYYISCLRYTILVRNPRFHVSNFLPYSTMSFYSPRRNTHSIDNFLSQVLCHALLCHVTVHVLTQTVLIISFSNFVPCSTMSCYSPRLNTNSIDNFMSQISCRALLCHVTVHVLTQTVLVILCLKFPATLYYVMLQSTSLNSIDNFMSQISCHSTMSCYNSESSKISRNSLHS